MLNFKINYHNVDLDAINNKLLENKKKINKVKQIFKNFPPFAITKNKKNINQIIKVTNALIKKKENIIVLGIGCSNLGAQALIVSSVSQ